MDDLFKRTFVHSAKKQLLQLKFEVRSLLATEPFLALPNSMVVGWTQYKVGAFIDIRECRVHRDTEFVIDGFQGSGNTFATVAFKLSQQRPVLVAHHLHAPAQVIKAVRLGIPTLVTIRDPAGAVLSLTSRWSYVSVRQALRGYVRFYEKIQPYRSGFVLSPFDQTTQHLDIVVKEVNRHFNRDYDLFEYTEANMLALRDPEKLASEAALKRRAIKAQKARVLEEPECQRLLQRAEQVFRSLEPYGVGSMRSCQQSA